MPTDLVLPCASIDLAEDAFALGLQKSDAVSGNKHLMKQIFFSWANLQQATRRLAALLSASFPCTNNELNLLSASVTVAAECYVGSQDDRNGAIAPAAAYLQGLLNTAAQGLACYDVFGVKGSKSSRWELSEEGLVAFSSRFEDLRFIGQEMNEDLVNGYHLILASRVLSVADAAMLSKSLRQTHNSEGDQPRSMTLAPVIQIPTRIRA